MLDRIKSVSKIYKRSSNKTVDEEKMDDRKLANQSILSWIWRTFAIIIFGVMIYEFGSSADEGSIIKSVVDVIPVVCGSVALIGLLMIVSIVKARKKVGMPWHGR